MEHHAFRLLINSKDRIKNRYTLQITLYATV